MPWPTTSEPRRALLAPCLGGTHVAWVSPQVGPKLKPKEFKIVLRRCLFDIPNP